MARVKLSEYDAKRLLLPALNQTFSGVSLTSDNYISVISSLPRNLSDTNLVVKVDQGIKKRGKKGLVKVNCTPDDVITAIKTWSTDWSHFLVEPVIEHADTAEHYLALERIRDGWQLSYSEKGGIDVEESWNAVQTVLVPDSSDLSAIRNVVKDRSELSAITEHLSHLIPAFEKYHIVFLEMNPVLIRDGKLIPLDMAAERDDAGGGEFSGIPVGASHASPAEIKIAELDASTPASLKFHLVNPAGRIWMLLSGGGASLVLADEVNDQGMGSELANYGEYSGSPTDDDVYAYTKIILKQLLESTTKTAQAIIIAGGVANFTDVAKTFKGIIHALGEVKDELVKAKVKVFVRRGGPNEAKGLQIMRDFLEQNNLFGSVHGHDISLTQVVTETKEYLL